ncbi:MAG: acyl-CoA dehydrogenase family protein [Burkholderiaceae bacterium]
MEQVLTQEDRAFRQEIRAFIERARPSAFHEKAKAGIPFDKDDEIFWQKTLDEAGYGAPAWPVEHGGTGWSPLRRLIFAEELAMNGCPRQSPYGLGMLGPVIMAYGNERQKRHYLPRIRSAEDWWCQGYSERGAGSDLAALRTRAVRDGDSYVVNGHKIWTSTAHEANMMFALVRTDDSGKRQQGITFLLIPMDAPGLSVRPLLAIDGNRRFNEVFLDDVRVPVDKRVGEEGQGWTYANALLQNERLMIADLARSKKRLARLRKVIAQRRVGGAPLSSDRGFMRRVAEAEIDLKVLEYTTLRFMSQEQAGRPMGAEVSLLKIRGSEIAQALLALTLEAAGTAALPYAASDAGADAWPDDYAELRGIVEDHLYYRAATIYGGTTEILKSVIARRVLGVRA